jgi:ketosteroid isomerase-like protein
MTANPAREADEAAVVVANEAFYRAFAARDLAAMDALWARTTPVVTVHPLGELVLGREWVMETWQLIFADPNQPRVVMGDALPALLSADVAYVTCREFAGGGAMVSTNLYVREGGEWRIAHHHSSPVVMLQG